MMFFTSHKAWFLVILLTGLVWFGTPVESYSSGISHDDAKNGCVCHGSSATINITITLSGLPEKYEVDETYDLEVKFAGGPTSTSDSQNNGGFSLTSSMGFFTPKNENTQIIDGSITHTTTGNNQRIWQIQWTAPSDDSKKVLFELKGNSVNGDAEPNEQDKWNSIEETVKGVNYTEDSSLTSLSFSIVGSTLVIGVVLRRSYARR